MATHPLFWALLAMVGFHAATVVVSGHPIGRHPAFVTVALALVTVGRGVLVLPFCIQPRLEFGPWRWWVGGAVLLLSLVIAAPALSIQWWKPAEPGMKLRTGGVYALTRNPLYLSEVLWPVGWSLMWQSVWGLALTPLWWLAFLLHTLVEEGRLERTLGAPYLAYRAKVRGRIFPGVPF